MLFDHEAAPRLFATPIGVDFCAALIVGLDARLATQPPEAIARVEIHVANARLQRRIQTLYAERGPGFLPRIRPVTALGDLADLAGLPPAISPLRLRLMLAEQIGRLIDAAPDLAPRTALYDLSDSLADLMAEMFEERVTPEMIHDLDVGSHSDHWARAQTFVTAITAYFAEEASLTPEARAARVTDHLIRQWEVAPPGHPVIVAGSTGSRGATARLMAAVARLPQGAVILPGLDREMPAAIWARLLQDRQGQGLAGEDHPQFRLARIAEMLGLDPATLPDWAPAMTPVNRARNAAVSLALRPAPVTDQWRKEGPHLPDLGGAFEGVTLLEAPSPQIEAGAIALRLRQAVDKGRRGALVSPDRILTRQVAAALDRWRITPDDSAGTPLDQTVAGRFLRLVAEVFCGPVTAEVFVAILSNPMCHSGTDRGPHLRLLREFELRGLRGKTGFPDPATLNAWAARQEDPAAQEWADWVGRVLLPPQANGDLPFADHVARHVVLAEALATGQAGADTGELYREAAGEDLARLLAELRAEGGAGGAMSARDYADMFGGLIADRQVRDGLRPHAQVLIWGTQEARVQGADLVILAGLNEGTWPAAPEADPWMNRPLRAAAGLRLPDRVIGLSAHDFQQAIAAPEVWLSRARRDAETDTVPARWLNRLTNLLDGASETSKAVLDGMRHRGDAWIAMAEALASPTEAQLAAARPASRPAPAPPLAARPRQLSVTQVETLIRDPYEIYARKVLRLKPLEPLRQDPDAGERGTVLHDILRVFVEETRAGLPAHAAARLMEIADDVLAARAPWPAARRVWRARLDRVAPHFLKTEAERRSCGAPWLLESPASWGVPGMAVTLTGTADRLDRLSDGGVAIYDYKTGQVPSEDQERAFTKQLWIEALMAEDGAFDGQDGPDLAAHIAYLGLGATPATVAHDPTPQDLAEIRAGLQRLLGHFNDPRTGYSARRAVFEARYTRDFDHLARYGEWDETEAAQVLPVGRTDD
ncbi:double-strand break repair protein AddB [Roseicyclus elongatus]|nr:double-strand break repair protein AddB [Roseibacterium elongatum]